MKRLIFILSALFFFVSASFITIQAQEIPERVQVKFRAKYPQLQPNWSTVDQGYQASFTEKGYPTQVIFDDKGTWLQTRTSLKKNQWPELSNQYLKDTHPQMKYLEGYKYETPKGTRYQLLLDDSAGKYRLDFDEEGGFINEEPAG
jgi:hypothetical protein